MLQELYIRNFALIEEARIPFGPGLTILTGETGSGKSIVLDALSLLLGDRASSDYVRAGADRASLEAVFSFLTPVSHTQDALVNLLEEAGIEWEMDGTLVIVRDLYANGKNVCRINGRTVTVNLLKQVGALLVDMAGQHENQILLRPEEHLKIIDGYGGQDISELKLEVAGFYREYQAAKKELQEARLGEQERVIRMDMLRFQLQEIEALRLKSGEEELLEQEHQRLAHAEKLFSVTQNLYIGLYDGDGRSPAILDAIAGYKHELEGALRFDESLRSVYELLISAQVQLEEASHEIRSYRDGIEFNPARLEKINERLASISKLKRKYGETVDEILAYAENIREELSRLENHEERLESLQRALEKSGQKLAQACLKLSEARKQVSRRVSELMMQELASLMMPKTKIEVSLTVQESANGLLVNGQRLQVTEAGIDQVEFLFAPNVGEPLRPLSKIASGGELSRMLLAWKSILADTSGLQTLVFDEIDTGISGRAAQAVAERMSHLAKSAQVLVVTHLPQVACMADAHLQIYKQQSGERVYTHVEQLTEQERIEVLARMLSGAELTDVSRQAAEEMLRLARVAKAG